MERRERAEEREIKWREAKTLREVRMKIKTKANKERNSREGRDKVKRKDKEGKEGKNRGEKDEVGEEELWRR